MSIISNKLVGLIDKNWPIIGINLRFIKHRLIGNRELDVARKFVRSDSIAIDVGARKGIYTRVMSGLVGPGGRVLAIEPNPLNVVSLRKVFSTKHNVIIHEYALSDRVGEAMLHVPIVDRHPQDALGNLREHASNEGNFLHYPIKLITLDDLISNLDTSVSFIKIDVEGHELAVLKGAIRSIRRYKPVIFVEIEQKYVDEPIQTRFEYMQSLGYETYFLDLNGEIRPFSMLNLTAMQIIPASKGHAYVNMFLFLHTNHLMML